MHYPSAFSEAFAEALAVPDEMWRGKRQRARRPCSTVVSGGGDEPSPQVPAESDD